MQDDTYNSVISARLNDFIEQYPCTFKEDFKSFPRWQTAFSSMSQLTEKYERLCFALLRRLFKSFTREKYLEANKDNFHPELVNAMENLDIEWDSLENFHGTFAQNLIFVQRYAMKFERSEFMYRRVALFTYQAITPLLRFSLETYYAGLVRRKYSPSGHILQNMGTLNLTEACVVMREPFTVDAADVVVDLESQNQFQKDLIQFSHSHTGMGIEVQNLKNVEIYKSIADECSTSGRKNVINFNHSVGSVHILDVLISTNPLSKAKPQNHLFTIGLLDDFMDAVLKDIEWGLFNVKDTEIYSSKVYRQLLTKHMFAKTVLARSLYNEKCRRMLEAGKPSIIFLDTMNRYSQFMADTTRYVGGSNLCTEISLPMKNDEYATCCVGTINAKQISSRACYDWRVLRETLSRRTNQLTDILNVVHLTSKLRYSRDYRPLAIGLMGFAEKASSICCDLKFHLKSRDCERCVERILEKFMEGIYSTAIQRSARWATYYIPFKNFEESSWALGKSQVELCGRNWNHLDPKSILDMSGQGIYNITLTGQPPTASMALLCNCSPGLEFPINSSVCVKTVSYYLNVTYASKFNAFEDNELSTNLNIVQASYLDQSGSHVLYIHEKNAAKLGNILGKLWRNGVKTGAYYTQTKLSIARCILSEVECEPCTN